MNNTRQPVASIERPLLTHAKSDGDLILNKIGLLEAGASAQVVLIHSEKMTHKLTS